MELNKKANEKREGEMDLTGCFGLDTSLGFFDFEKFNLPLLVLDLVENIGHQMWKFNN